MSEVAEALRRLVIGETTVNYVITEFHELYFQYYFSSKHSLSRVLHVVHHLYFHFWNKLFHVS